MKYLPIEPLPRRVPLRLAASGAGKAPAEVAPEIVVLGRLPDDLFVEVERASRKKRSRWVSFRSAL